MSRIGLLLHLHQSPIQDESTLREVTEQCYIPLVKLIKSKRKFKLTLSISLSLLEQLDRLNYTSLINSIKELVEGGSVALAGTAAYSPLLTRLPQEFVEKQIILNEFAQGYYFGKKGGFEGDPSIMLQNVTGIFPPELALNEKLINIVSDLGYEWILADETSVKDGFGLYTFKESNTKIVVRNTKISNMLSSNKIEDVPKSLDEINKEIVIALRGEVFGYENKNGISLLEDLVNSLSSKDTYFVSINEFIERANELPISNVSESNWSVGKANINNNAVYSKWDTKSNKNQRTMWKLLNTLTKLYKFSDEQSLETGFEELAIWRKEDVNKIGGEDLVKLLEQEMLLSKVMCSEQFLLELDKARPYIDMYLKLAEELGDSEFLKLVKEAVK